MTMIPRHHTVLTIDGTQARTPFASFKIETVEPLGPPADDANPAPAGVAGAISDSNWTRAALSDFDKAMEGALANLIADAHKTKGKQFEDYIPAVRDAKKAEAVIPSLQAIDNAMAKEIKEREAGLALVQAIQAAAGTIAEPSTELEALRHDLAAREIRAEVKSLPPKDRVAVLKRAVEEGDIFTIAAIGDSLVSLFDDQLHPQIVQRAKDEIVSSKHPWLATMLEHRNHVANAARVRAAEYRSMVNSIMTRNGLDPARIEQYRQNLSRKIA